jgi:hypothetical protein
MIQSFAFHKFGDYFLQANKRIKKENPVVQTGFSFLIRLFV